MRHEDVQSNEKLARYRSFFKQDPANLNLFCELLDLEMQFSNVEECKVLINEGDKVWPEEPSFLHQKASYFIANGMYHDAITIYLDFFARGIDNAVVRYNCGYAYLMMNDFEQAHLNFETLVGESSEIKDVYYQMARVSHHLGKVDEGISYAHQYIDEKDNLPDFKSDIYGIVSLLYLDNSEQDKAQDFAELSLSFDDTNREALVTMGNVSFEKLSVPEASNYFSRAITQHPNSGRAYSGLGLCHMMDKDLTSAEDVLTKSVLYMPGHIGTWHALAWCQLVLNKVVKAEKSFIAALDVDRNFGETHGGLAVIDYLNGNEDEAKRKIKIALKLDPDSFSARFADSLIVAKYDKEKAESIIKDIFDSDIRLNGKSLRDIVSEDIRKHSK